MQKGKSKSKASTKTSLHIVANRSRSNYNNNCGSRRKACSICCGCRCCWRCCFSCCCGCVVLDSFISIVKFAINCSSAAQRQPSANYVHASNRYRYRNRSVTDTRGHSSGRCRQNYKQIQIQAVLWIQIQRIRNYKFTVYKYSVQHSE